MQWVYAENSSVWKKIGEFRDPFGLKTVIFFFTKVFETYIVNKTLNFIVDLPETVRI